uniref:Putative secreted protein n=1 Tax=Anopheles darlingi TaxID=43151 RepID=A0A2M4DNM2_ANODA
MVRAVTVVVAEALVSSSSSISTTNTIISISTHTTNSISSRGSSSMANQAAVWRDAIIMTTVPGQLTVAITSSARSCASGTI